MSVSRLGPGRRIPYGMAIGPLLLLAIWCASSALGALDRRVLSGPWTVLVVVEQINAESGIVYMMSLARSYGQTEIIIVGLAVYGSFGLVSDGAIRWVERRALSWRRTLAG